MSTTVRKKDNSNQQIVINNLTIRPVVRSTQDVEKWRNAMKSAEAINPIRVPLYDLYEDLLLDGTLSSVAGKRVLGVTKVPIRYYDPNGKEVEAITKELIKKMQFRYLRKEIQKQKSWGITVPELAVVNGEFKVFSVPRKHIRADLGKIVYEQYGTEGIDYTIPPYSNYIFQVGDRYDLGLLLKAAPYVIYKRGGFGDWSKFAEIFGMPFREARYDGYNDAVRVQLIKALEEAGSAAYAVLPKEAEFKLHETRGTQGSSTLYNDLRKACNEELAILFLGQTETTSSSSSSGYAQSKTHADVEDDINADDLEDELAVMNEQVAPILRNLGYPIVDGGYFGHVVQDKTTKKEKAGIIVSLHQGTGLPLDDDDLYETFGIKKPDDYNEQKALRQAQGPTPKPPTDPTDDPEAEPTDKTDAEPVEAEAEDDKKLSAIWYKLRHKLADFFDPAPEAQR